MVGDGINDVLALKEAQLGVALNGGSQAARAVADLVLLDDAFSALPHAFLEGQRILNGMRDVLKLFLTRVLYVTLLIVSLGLVADGFPFAPKHSSLFVLFTVGLPTLALAACASPGRPSRDTAREVLHFIVPAAVTLTLMALGVFIGVLAGHKVDLRMSGTVAECLAAFDDAQVFAQSAVTTFSVLAGLLLIPFAKPPTRCWAVAAPLANDWRPTLAAAVLLVC
jgi:cation-transporting ATPase E